MSSYLPLALSKKTLSPDRANRRYAILGLVLHGSLVVAHLILVAVMCLRLERRVVVDIGHATTVLSLSITVASQVTATVGDGSRIDLTSGATLICIPFSSTLLYWLC